MISVAHSPWAPCSSSRAGSSNQLHGALLLLYGALLPLLYGALLPLLHGALLPLLYGALLLLYGAPIGTRPAAHHHRTLAANGRCIWPLGLRYGI